MGLKHLPEERNSEVKRGSLLQLLIGIVVVIIIINSAVSMFLHTYSTNLGYRQVFRKWKMLHNLKSPVDTLILGDSSGNTAVAPEIVSAELGGSAINLCSIGGLLLVNDVWMLETYIAKYGAPNKVIIVHSYGNWHRSINPAIVAQIPLPFLFGKAMVLKNDIAGSDMSTYFLTRYCPLYSQNATIKKTLKSLIRPSQKAEVLRGLIFKDNGQMLVTQSNPTNVLEDKERHEESLTHAKAVLSEENMKAYEQLGALTKQYSFPVFISQGPLYEGLYANSKFKKLVETLNSALMREASKYEFIQYVGTRPILFSKDEMENVDHISGSNAVELYTKTLCKQIKRFYK